VLDLGPSVGANVEALGSRGWRVQVATLDLPPGPDGWGAEAPRLGRLLEEALGQPAAPITAPTLILLWDRVNYLDLGRLPMLVRALEPWCGNPTHALALVATHKEQPSAPGTFRIENGDTLAYRWMENGDPRIQSPRHRPAQLEKAMQPFRVAGSWILRNGIQECLLRRDA
jgi:hypothetical protein